MAKEAGPLDRRETDPQTAGWLATRVHDQFRCEACTVDQCGVMSTILVIEDDHNLREGLELLFEFEGYATLGSSNGISGMELIRRHHPDVILTNFQMPGADGFEVLRSVREHPEISETPIIFLTANHSPSLRERALRDGADVFFTKPFRIDELTRTVARLLSQREHEYS